MAALNNAQALSEWFSKFRGFIVGCGEASALVVERIVKGQPISTQELTQLIQNAANNNQLSGAGFGQTAPNVQWDLAQYGISSSVVYNPASQLKTLIDNALAAGKPVILGVNNGSALSNETSGLRGHYITIVGEQGNNFITADPNTQAAVSGEFTQNSLQQLLNSSPFAAITPNQGGSGGGNNNGFPQCVANCAQNNPIGSPTYDACILQCAIGGAAGSAVGNAASDLGSSIAQGISSGLGNAFNTAGTNLSKQLGTKSISDALWRAAIIVGALILLIVGIFILAKDAGVQTPKPPVMPVPV